MCCSTAFVFSDNEEESSGYRATYPDQGVEVNQLSIAPAHSRKGHFSYGETNANVSKMFFSNKSIENNIVAGLRNVHIGLGSKIQPKNTLYGVLGIQSTYTGVEDWSWTGNFVIQPNLKNMNLARTTRYIASLHGRYEVIHSTGLHVGFYAEIGIRAPLVRPLLGIDYTIGPWLLQAIFPIKYGLTYKGISNHMFSLMARPFYTAVHVKKGLHDTPATARYKGTGGELRWDYLPTLHWNFWLSLGYTLAGNLSIGDKNNNHRHHVYPNNAPYFNIGVTFGL
jgi:hypothetical protein